MIYNIQVLINPDPPINPILQAKMAQEQLLIKAHRRGEQPWGSMRRDCPLCQLGR